VKFILLYHQEMLWWALTRRIQYHYYLQCLVISIIFDLWPFPQVHLTPAFVFKKIRVFNNWRESDFGVIQAFIMRTEKCGGDVLLVNTDTRQIAAGNLWGTVIGGSAGSFSIWRRSLLVLIGIQGGFRNLVCRLIDKLLIRMYLIPF